VLEKKLYACYFAITALLFLNCVTYLALQNWNLYVKKGGSNAIEKLALLWDLIIATQASDFSFSFYNTLEVEKSQKAASAFLLCHCRWSSNFFSLLLQFFRHIWSKNKVTISMGSFFLKIREHSRVLNHF